MALFGMAVEDMPEFKNPDAGEYDATIVKSELTESRKKDPMIVLTVALDSEDPDINGSKLKYYHMVPDKKNEYYDMQIKSTQRLCVNLGLDGDPEIEDFEGIQCRVMVTISENDSGDEFANIKSILAA